MGLPPQQIERMRADLEAVCAATDPEAKRAALSDAVLNFGPDFAKFLADEKKRDPERYSDADAQYWSILTPWLAGARLSDRADEDARRAQFALYFAELAPGLGRLAAKAVLELPDGHPDRNLDRVRAALFGQLRAGIESAISVVSALDAIAGLLQLELLPVERSLQLIETGCRIIERANLSENDDNFRAIAVPYLLLQANAAERDGDPESAGYYSSVARKIVESLGDRADFPADTILLIAVMRQKDGDQAQARELYGKALRMATTVDVRIFAALQASAFEYAAEQYESAVQILLRYLPQLEESYLTAVETTAIKKAGSNFSEALVRLAFCYARLGNWNESVRLLDRSKSLRLRYEGALRRTAAGEKLVRLEDSLYALSRGLVEHVSDPGVNAVTDPVGARLSLETRLLEAYRQERSAIDLKTFDSPDIAGIAALLGKDEAAVMLGDSGVGLLIVVIRSTDRETPCRSAILSSAVTSEIVKVLADPGNGWLVAVGFPGMVADPRTSLSRALETTDRLIGGEIARLLQDEPVRRLIIVPHNLLHIVPWWALASLEGYEVLTVPAAALIARIQAAPRRLDGLAVVLGNPTLDLPVAAVEAASVAEKLRARGFEVDLVTGESATKNALKEKLRNASLLHFAGHGRSDLVRPSRSSVELSPETALLEQGGGEPLADMYEHAEWSEQKDNERWADIPGRGRLTERVRPVTGRMDLFFEYDVKGTILAEYVLNAQGDEYIQRRVSELWTAADLITERLLTNCGLCYLSSCEAGLGGLSTGFDEFAGLPAALDMASVGTVICPLWPVEDTVSAIFAGLIYEALGEANGQVDVASLVAATRERLRTMNASEASERIRALAAHAVSRGTRMRLEGVALHVSQSPEPPFADPYFWAAFYTSGAARVAIGEAQLTAAAAPPVVPRPRRVPSLSERSAPASAAIAEAPAKEPVDLAAAYEILARHTGDPTMRAEAARRFNERALKLLGRKEFARAQELFEKALEFEPALTAARIGLATVLVGLGKLAECMQELDRAVELAPDDAAGYRDRAGMRMVLGNMAGATEDAARGVELAPAEFKSYQVRAAVLAAASNFTEALKDYEEAVRLQPDNTASYIARGGLHLQLGNDEAALADFAIAARMEPEQGLIYLSRAPVYAKLNNLEGVFRDCDAAVMILPDPVPAYANRGYYYAALGKLERGLEDLNKAIELNPDYAPAYYQRAAAYSLAEKEDTLILMNLIRAIRLMPALRQNAAIDPAFEWARGNVSGLRIYLGLSR